MADRIALTDIMRAKKRIAAFIKETPLIRAEKLEELFDGAKIYLKCENMQNTGSFKVRGVANKMCSLTGDEKKHGVTAASSGNHAQAVSYIAQKLGIKACIVMPENAPESKISGAKSYGAKVILHGFTGEDRDAKCYELIKKYSYSLVHSHTDPLVIAGHGTLAAELYQQIAGSFDELVIPCGAGSLTSGAAFTMKKLDNSITTTAVEPAEVPRFKESIKSGRPVTVEMGDTIADGLRVSKAETINFEMICENVDHLIAVQEASIRQAVKEIAMRAKIVAEPSACVGIAAALEGKINTSKGRKIVFIISGGNMDSDMLSRLL